MATVSRSVGDVCQEAKEASHVLARASRETKDAALLDLAKRLEDRSADLIDANAADVEAGQAEGLNDALIDRLTLTEERIADMAAGVREIAGLDDPIGEVVEGWKLDNGLDIKKE